MNPNVAPETQFVGQPAPDVPPQPSVAGFASAQTPEQPFTITGPAQPIQQEAPIAPPPIPPEFLEQPPAPEPPPPPQYAPEDQVVQPNVQPGPEAVPPPAPEAQVTQTPVQPLQEAPPPAVAPYPSPEAQTTAQSMAPNLGPDVATAARDAEVLAAMAIPKAEIDDIKGNKIGVSSPEPVLVGIDPNAEKSAEIQNTDTKKKITNSLALAQHAWDEANKSTDPEARNAKHVAIQGALEKDLTEILGQDWKVPTPEEAWS